MMFDNAERPPWAIEITGLTKRYAAHVVLDEVTARVPWGSVTGLVGANGAGKTTLLRTLTGLTRADAGATAIAGRPYAAWPRPREVAGAVLDRLGAHPAASGRHHLRTLAVGAGLPPGSVRAVLDAVGLGAAADRPVRTYSTGMRQRLALGAALVGRPPILLLDEPASGLDVLGIA